MEWACTSMYKQVTWPMPVSPLGITADFARSFSSCQYIYSKDPANTQLLWQRENMIFQSCWITKGFCYIMLHLCRSSARETLSLAAAKTCENIGTIQPMHVGPNIQKKPVFNTSFSHDPTKPGTAGSRWLRCWLRAILGSIEWLKWFCILQNTPGVTKIRHLETTWIKRNPRTQEPNGTHMET
jgi:hypothetical protein